VQYVAPLHLLHLRHTAATDAGVPEVRAEDLTLGVGDLWRGRLVLTVITVAYVSLNSGGA